ncbi:protein Eaa [Salmonella enterica]|uniref:protein Eaa n=1 Tax=Salmonella enterica TaxID=28901 RepID=UPI0009AD38E2|nr:protein Eaa [Salmonella enterica]EAB9740735.1 protein Eaa [Salmonella enterica subsp. diarizonae]EBP3772025.1 protein Eaa [Salmonella enterica subsp. arizonae]EDB6444227.1 protein Eaa [Salmonella enterica subsp. enterica serovar Newport]EDX3026679.1 protein Eaa [Salmonella enterica subsp. houtenae serovar 48:g,z51:-]EEI3684418.1 protein Eaa [Salmonella enterica subsp. enterica]MBA3159939.1 protein Eaa [Salmonella enterica subsp. arizonae serovar 48:z4,z24:-]
MTTITREQLIEKLQNRIAVTANYPGVEEAQLDAAIFKIALASLEAKPIGAFHIADQQVDGTTDYIKDGEWPIDNGVIDVYAVPPASVVPEGLVKAVRFYEQVKRENPPVETGAWKDAVDWVLKEACKAVSMLESSREHEVISQQEKA